MDRDSARLTLAGALLGLLALSATVVAGLQPPPARSPAEAAASAQSGPVGGFPSEAAVPVLATEPETPAETGSDAGPFRFSLRITEPVPDEKLFVCDGLGCPLEEIRPDADGDALLGPLPPGRYGVWHGQTQIGSFRLADNASVPEAEGRLWTDGELLHLERFIPGTVRFTLRLPKPGYYGFLLWDRCGRRRSGDLFLPDNAVPDPTGAFVRSLRFGGLAPGLYTLARDGTVLAQIEVRAAETAEAELIIEN